MPVLGARRILRPALGLLALASLTCEDAGRVPAAPADDEFVDLASREQAEGLACPAGAICTGSGATYTSSYRVGSSPTSRGELIQTFTAPTRVAPAKAVVAVRALRAFTLPEGAPVPRLHADLYAIDDLAAPDLSGTPLATGSNPIPSGALPAGTGAITLTATAPLEAGGKYALHFWTDDLPVSSTQSLLLGLAAYATDTYSPEGTALRRSPRRTEAGAPLGDSRPRSAGPWQIALSLETEPCSPLSTVCPTTCSGDEECGATKWCEDGACVAKRANGAACERGAQCGTGACADGYCCDRACTGACESCGLTGAEGTCTALARDALDPTCTPFRCDANGACRSACTGDAHCSPGNSCSDGVCVNVKPDGATCSLATECESGWCVGGTCCESACDAPASGCFLAQECSTGACLTPPKAAGQACADDGNPCTDDVCDGAGGCTHPPKTGTVACSDGKSCTTGDTCQAGTCVGTTACAQPPGECWEPIGACNASGACSYAPKADGTACTDDGNVCTTDRCNGSGQCIHPAGNAGTVCRAAAGDCDTAEACSGSSTSCPADQKVAAGTVCRASAGLCDAAESCNGSANTCPSDAKVAAGTICRNAAGECDLAETCSGSSNGCPADVRKAGGTACSTDANACTTDTCDGTSASCQHPAVANGTSCGSVSYGAWSACSYASTCANSGSRSRTVTAPVCTNGGCGNSTYTETEACSRNTNGTVCAGSSYSGWSACGGYGGTCDSTGTQSRTRTDYTCSSGSCVGANYGENQGCSRTTNGTACNDGNACTSGDVCSGDVCAGSNTTECTPGQTQSAACGNCGTTTRTCDSCGHWGGWSACSGQGVCAPGATNTVYNCGACGNGTRTDTCTSSCQWSAGTCSACSPGATQYCGTCNCGTKQRTCSATCTWGSCVNGSDCRPSGTICP